MKDELVPIDGAGRVVLPKRIREELAIRAGDLLLVSVRGNEVTLAPSRETTGFVRKGKALVFSAGVREALRLETVSELREAQQETRVGAVVAGLSKSKGRQ